MPNDMTNLYQTKVVPRLYQQYYQGAFTSFMENNAIGVEYTGGKYVTMSEMSVDGLGNYDRNLGFVRGNVTGSKKQYEMTMDRGREFLIDVADNDETGFLVNAGSVMSLFQNEHVIPEIDAYRISKIFSTVNTKAAANVKADAIDPDEITYTLADDIAELRDKVGNVPLVIMMSGITQKYFGREFLHNLDYVNFARGGLNTKVKSLDGDPFMIIPSARMKSAYTFYDGLTTGQEKGGFVAASGAKDIKWIIMPASAAIAVAKIDKSRVFDPNTYQGAHAWKTDYRIFHDLWMTPNGYNNTIIRTGDIVAPATGE
jgi:hypothetical protein